MSDHRLGFAVKVLGDGGLPSHDTRRWQSDPHLCVSLERVSLVLEYLDRNDIRMYRMTSDLAPYATHPELTRFHGQIDECKAELAEVGAKARDLGIRLSFHPGQYTVLNSENETTRANAAADLEVQARLLEGLGAGAEAVVVLHVGGAAGGKEAGTARFEQGLELLSDRARGRLVIENDDRSYDLADVLALSERTGIPVVWDAHHHRCIDSQGIPDREALRLALATWPSGVTPKIHFSSPRLDLGERKRKDGRRVVREPVFPQLRQHADLIDPVAFEAFAREALAGTGSDVMLEAKGKDLALLRLREQLSGRGFGWEEGRLRLPG